MFTCSTCGGDIRVHSRIEALEVRIAKLEAELRELREAKAAPATVTPPGSSSSCKWCGTTGICDCEDRAKCALVGRTGHAQCGRKGCGCPNFVPCGHESPAPPAPEFKLGPRTRDRIGVAAMCDPQRAEEYEAVARETARLIAEWLRRDTKRFASYTQHSYSDTLLSVANNIARGAWGTE